MKHITLSKNHFALVDDCDYEAVLAVGKWSYTRSGYACHYWRDSDGKRHTLYLHRFIYARVLGHAIPPKLQVDHKSAREEGEAARLDNRRSNLRMGTANFNQAAKGPQVNTLYHKGVTLRNGKFDVRLRYYNHRLHVGRYTNFDLAVAVYQYCHRALWQDWTSEGQSEVQLPSAIQDKLNKQIATVLKTVSRL